MNSDNLLLTVAVIAVIISFVGINVTYNSINTFENILTGFVTETGYVNVSITASTAINISSANGTSGSKLINWGDGSVDSGKDRAILVTNGTVQDGSWSAVDSGFIIENIGNVNVTLDIHSNETAIDMFGALSSPRFQYNLSDSQAGSCVSFVAENTFINFTTSPVEACSNFLTDGPGGADEVRLDILLDIPSGATPGNRYVEVILTATQV